MKYWSDEDIEEMNKRNNKMMMHRKIAIGLAIPMLLTSFLLTVIAIFANDPFWITIFTCFTVFAIYFIVKQFHLLKEDMNWKPRDPKDYYPTDKN